MTSHRIQRRHLLRRWLPAGLVVLAVVAAVIAVTHFHGARPKLLSPSTTVGPVARFDGPRPGTTRASTPESPAPGRCAANTAAQHVFVSIGAQHAWMCAGSRQVNQSAVTTGASASGDGTPTGTWHVQAKQTDRWLTPREGGSYHVDYWLPYDGSYGFHDARWQTFPYGGPQYRTIGSHGCVHLPLAVMRWLYGWAQVGATVTIEA